MEQQAESLSLDNLFEHLTTDAGNSAFVKLVLIKTSKQIKNKS
jgi:hypothetical protein